MFFKEKLISIAEIIDAKFKGDATIANRAPSDKGELCELFIKQVLIEALGDSFKIFRGGRIVDYTGAKSKQIDIILTGKKNIRFFEDKGIYPTETVYGCISVTATLSKKKLIDCCNEFISIPKTKFSFRGYGFLPEKYMNQSIELWKTLIPYKCIFAFQGDIKEDWIKIIKETAKNWENIPNAMPDLVIVNKVGFIEKKFTKEKTEFKFTSFSDTYKNYGTPLGKLLYHINNFNWEEFILPIELSRYLNMDL